LIDLEYFGFSGFDLVQTIDLVTFHVVVPCINVANEVGISIFRLTVDSYVEVSVDNLASEADRFDG
jgi:hypothetical protein